MRGRIPLKAPYVNRFNFLVTAFNFFKIAGMKYSIIIPTYNEAHDIRETLDSLVRIDWPDKEIIVVDDSTDKTPDIVREYADKGVNLIHPGGGGRCEARNRGILSASGEIVCILNADVRLPVNFIKEIDKHYAAGADYVLVASRVTNREALLARYVGCVSDWENVKTSWIEWTEGFSCRKNLAIEAGLFPTGYPVPICAGEDGYFGNNLRKRNAQRRYDENIMVSHVMPEEFNDFWANRVGRGRGYSQVRSFLDNWSHSKIQYFIFLKFLFFVLKIITVVPGFLHTYRVARFSQYRWSDIFRLYYPWLIENMAFIVGAQQELKKIQRQS